MSRAAFHLLLERYLENRCTDEEKEIIEKWYGMLDKADGQDAVPSEITALEQKLWDRIQDEAGSVVMPNEVKTHKPVKKLAVVLMAAAAVFTGLILLVGDLFFNASPKQPAFISSLAAHTIKTQINHSNHTIKVVLEDGSQVSLQPKSTLRYPEHFSAAVREVMLDGEGFFEISKNPSRPFLVYNKNVITRVLGTSFVVKNNPSGSETEVAVKTGKVMVLPNTASLVFKIKHFLKTDKQVVLTPNQKTVYSVVDHKFETGLVNNPVPLIQKNKLPLRENYSFNETAVADILAQMQKTYGIQITVQDKELYRDTFTGDLSDQSLYRRLDFICEAIKASYHVSGTKIIISKQN